MRSTHRTAELTLHLSWCLQGPPCWTLVLGLIASSVAGCTDIFPSLIAPQHPAPPPKTYQVKSGDTLFSIGQHFDIPHQKLARWNGIKEPHELYVGQRLRLHPPTRKGDSRSIETETGVLDTKHQPRAQKRLVATVSSYPLVRAFDPKEPVNAPPSRWRWPVKGKVIISFKPGKKLNNGIDIAAPLGTLVQAAASGEVVYSDNNLYGYGNLVILRHPENYLTAYGYNQENLVTEGAYVESGQGLARVGETGAATEPSLHFEVRRRASPIDPLSVLPPLGP